MKYQLDVGRDGAPTGAVVREADDGVVQFFDPAADTAIAREYQAWLAAGNAPARANASTIAAARIDFLAFMALFTPNEQAALVSSTDIQVRLFLLEASGAGEIDLSDTRVETALRYLEGRGLLTPGRAASILASQAP